VGRTVRCWFGSNPKWFSDPAFVQMRRRAADHSAREKQERDFVEASEFAYIDDGELKTAKA
jgi:hypothetical protein